MPWRPPLGRPSFMPPLLPLWLSPLLAVHPLFFAQARHNLAYVNYLIDLPFFF